MRWAEVATEPGAAARLMASVGARVQARTAAGEAAAEASGLAKRREPARLRRRASRSTWRYSRALQKGTRLEARSAECIQPFCSSHCRTRYRGATATPIVVHRSRFSTGRSPSTGQASKSARGGAIGDSEGSLTIHLFLMQYAEGRRVASVSRRLRDGVNRVQFRTAPNAEFVAVAIRFTGVGSRTVGPLSLFVRRPAVEGPAG
jgi:hypothetical protein